jgi:hypothetical protein
MNKAKETSASAADEAAKTTLALNRLVGFNNQHLLASAQTFITSAITQPQIPVAQWFSLLDAFGKIATGQSERAAPAGRQEVRGCGLEDEQTASGADAELSRLGGRCRKDCSADARMS